MVQGGEATSERRRRDGVSGKSHLRGLSPPLKKHSPCLGDANQRTACIGSFPRVHELVAGSSAWQVRAVKGGAKVGSFTTSHDYNNTTRANISHEKAEQIRARIVCTPAGYGWRGRG